MLPPHGFISSLARRKPSHLLDFALKRHHNGKSKTLRCGFSCQAKIFEAAGLTPANEKAKVWRENTRADAGPYGRVMLKVKGVDPHRLSAALFGAFRLVVLALR
jgi:hypothetical protein